MHGGLWRGGLVAVVGMLVAVIAVSAAEEPTGGSLVKMKAGACRFTLLDPKGVQPLAGWNLVLESPRDGTPVVQGVTDGSGVCNLDVAPGRYVLSVNEMDLAILDASPDLTISDCRIVVPEIPMAVGGEEAGQTPPAPSKEEKESRKGGFWLTSGAMTPYVVGAAIILVGAGGYAIVEHNQDEGEGVSVPTPPPPTLEPVPSPVRKPRRPAEPEPVSR